MKMKAVQFTFLLLVFYCFESSIGVDEEVSASGMESGSSGSGDFLSDRDEEIRRISELQTSIPYKKLYNLKKCEDDPEADCEGLSQEKCLQEFNDMVEDCPWSCHFCAKEGEYTSRCEDLNNHCPSYAQRGDCQRLPDYMMQTCKKSCQFCGTESKDVDKHAVCPIWGREGYCQTDEDIRLACPHSCKKYKGVQPAPQSYPYPIKALHPYQYQAGQYPIPVPNPYPNTYPAPYPYQAPYPYPYPYPSHYPTQYPYPTPSPYPTPPAPTPAPYPTPPAPVPAPYPTPPAPVPAPYPTPPAPVPAPYPTPPAPVPAPYPTPPAPGPAPYPTPATPPAAPPPAPPPPYPVSPPPYPAAPPPPPPTYPAAPAPPPPTYPAAPAPPGGTPSAPTYDKSERERKQQRKHFKHKKYHSTEHKNKKHN